VTDEAHEPEQLSAEELEEQEAEPLPDREAMSIVDLGPDGPPFSTDDVDGTFPVEGDPGDRW